MVLDAMEDEGNQEVDDYEQVDIPILDRHLGKRAMDGESRIPSKEEILQQRQEMLQEEMMQENEEQDQYEEAEDDMNGEACTITPPGSFSSVLGTSCLFSRSHYAKWRECFRKGVFHAMYLALLPERR